MSKGYCGTCNSNTHVLFMRMGSRGKQLDFMHNSPGHKLEHERDLVCKFIQSRSSFNRTSLEGKSHMRWPIILLSSKRIRRIIPCKKTNNKIYPFPPKLHGSLLFYCCARSYKWASVILIAIILHFHLYKVENAGQRSKQALWENAALMEGLFSSSVNAACLRFCLGSECREWLVKLLPKEANGRRKAWYTTCAHKSM